MFKACRKDRISAHERQNYERDFLWDPNFRVGGVSIRKRAGIKGCSVCKFAEIEHLNVSEAESMVTHYSIRI